MTLYCPCLFSMLSGLLFVHVSLSVGKSYLILNVEKKNTFFRITASTFPTLGKRMLTGMAREMPVMTMPMATVSRTSRLVGMMWRSFLIYLFFQLDFSNIVLRTKTSSHEAASFDDSENCAL